jgi:hypothetical protein
MSGSVPGAIQPIQPYQPPDMIGQAGQIGQLKNLLISNQVNQQQLAARNAVGQAYQQSINPDGSLNTPKFTSLVANNPAAALDAGDAVAQAQARQQGQLQINQGQLAQTTNRLGVYRQAFGPLLAKGTNISPNDVYGVIQGLGAAGMPTDEVAADVSATMPVMDPTKASNPAYQAQYGQALHNWVQQQWGSNQSGETQANVFRPSVSLVNTGGGIQGVDTNPSTNPGVVGSSMPLTLSPGEAVSPQTGTNPDGSTYSMPTATYAQRTGLGGVVFPGSTGGGAGGAPQGTSIFGTGRLPGRGAPYSGPTAGSASAGGSNPPGTIQTGIGPGQAAAASVAGSGSATDLHNLYAYTSNSGARLYQLGKALTGLQTLGPQGTGPNTDAYNNLKSFAQSLPVIGGLSPFDSTKIADFDETNKYLTAYASQQASNLGTGTDAKLATALTSNASTHISNLAAVDVVKSNIALERMQQAEAQAFTASGQSPDQFDKFASSWNQTADPRVYAFDLMTPQARGTMLKGMSSGQQTQFFNQVWSASQNGFIDPSKSGLSTGGAQ